MKSSNFFIIAIAVCISFFFIQPRQGYAQLNSWEDRSDEIFDNSNNTTTYILIGAGVGLATAAIVYTIKNRRDSEEKQQTEKNDEIDSEKKVQVMPFIGLNRSPEYLKSNEQSISNNLVVGLSIDF